MIDVESKILYFGDGDILVNSDLICLKFVNCKPPLQVGTILTDEIRDKFNVKYTSDWINISFLTYDEIVYFEKLLNEVLDRTTHYFYFRDYQFNFANWNPKSVEVIKAHLSNVKQTLLMTIAC